MRVVKKHVVIPKNVVNAIVSNLFDLALIQNNSRFHGYSEEKLIPLERQRLFFSEIIDMTLKNVFFIAERVLSPYLLIDLTICKNSPHVRNKEV